MICCWPVLFSILGEGIGKNPLILYFADSVATVVVLKAPNSLTVVAYKLDREFLFSMRAFNLLFKALLSKEVALFDVCISSFVFEIEASSCWISVCNLVFSENFWLAISLFLTILLYKQKHKNKTNKVPVKTICVLR